MWFGGGIFYLIGEGNFGFNPSNGLKVIGIVMNIIGFLINIFPFLCKWDIKFKQN